MNRFAIELSTNRASLAIETSVGAIFEEEWDEQQGRRERMFDVLPDLLRRAGLTLAQIDEFVISRGPGAFAGIRVAVTAAQSFAMPAKKPVRAVNSALVAAWPLLVADPSRPVAVVGDARRDSYWCGVVSVSRGKPVLMHPWKPWTFEELTENVPVNARVISPDWSRIGAKIVAALTDREITGSPVYPTARALLALARVVDSEPVEPLYLHPPV